MTVSKSPRPLSTSTRFFFVHVNSHRCFAFLALEESPLAARSASQPTMPPRKAAAKAKLHNVEDTDIDNQNCLLRIDKGTDVYGILVIELDSGRAPRACELVAQNIPGSSTTDKSRGKQGVYKNCRFSRLTKEGIQTGEVAPAAKSVSAAELEGELGRVPHCYGSVSLCRSSTSFDGSQFFVCLTSDSVELDHLNKKYVCFGRVVEGQDVLASLQSDLSKYTEDMGLVRKDCPYVMAELSYASM
ncbi:hypothetical protein GH5_04888 [Leishmania sp. Ghana 2012 LV757]|uniref:hypothetical protein n=1 Tax=Leishmania sp. Ghana 2012 LV757 TaxID=2803181 RepID=UPI001B74EE76|nr:hypothetical protein GH5_04888 [Leishmania sp. Ghana 2012 LV757]